MSTHPETIEHEGRTYRLVPDEAEKARARARADRLDLLRAANQLVTSPGPHAVVTPTRSGAVVSPDVIKVGLRLLTAILEEVSDDDA